MIIITERAQPNPLLVTSQSVGFTISASCMRNDSKKRNNSSAKRMDAMVAAEIREPTNHINQVPLCVSSGPSAKLMRIEAEESKQAEEIFGIHPSF